MRARAETVKGADRATSSSGANVLIGIETRPLGLMGSGQGCGEVALPLLTNQWTRAAGTSSSERHESSPPDPRNCSSRGLRARVAASSAGDGDGDGIERDARDERRRDRDGEHVRRGAVR